MRNGVAMRVSLVTIALLATGAAAQPAAETAPACAEPTPLVVEDAPGGGEMIVLDAARRYVTRARRGESGAVEGGCGHDRPAAPAAGAPRR